MTTIAIPDTQPPIVCPSWCTVDYESHLTDRPQLEGFVIRWSELSRPVYLGRGAPPGRHAGPRRPADDPPREHDRGVDGRPG